MLENSFRESEKLHSGCLIEAKAACTWNRKPCISLDKQTYPLGYIRPPAELLTVVTVTEAIRTEGVGSIQALGV